MAGQSPLPPPRVLTYAAPTTTTTTTPPPTTLITQGAEGLLYRTTYLSPATPCALKYRPAKPYRHPLLDARLTRQRILAEARILAKCRREGVPVPGVYCVDEAGGWLMMEWVEGAPVRVRVNAWLGHKSEEEVVVGVVGVVGVGGGGDNNNHNNNNNRGTNGALVGLMRRVGAAVGRLHAAGVVHGDLTTSNMMLRPWIPPEEEADTNDTTKEGSNGGGDGDEALEGEIVIIDFGLASQGTHEEDRAVDLYVLERAFLSTHPRTEKLFGEVLEGYKETFKGAKPVLRKLEDVRMRGRKRSMIG